MRTSDIRDKMNEFDVHGANILSKGFLAKQTRSANRMPTRTTMTMSATNYMSSLLRKIDEIVTATFTVLWKEN